MPLLSWLFLAARSLGRGRGKGRAGRRGASRPALSLQAGMTTAEAAAAQSCRPASRRASACQAAGLHSGGKLLSNAREIPALVLAGVQLQLAAEVKEGERARGRGVSRRGGERGGGEHMRGAWLGAAQQGWRACSSTAHAAARRPDTFFPHALAALATPPPTWACGSRRRRQWWRRRRGCSRAPRPHQTGRRLRQVGRWME